MPLDRSNYPGIPQDFPIEEVTSALAGVQPKLNLVEEDGRYYASGTNPSAVQETFEMCEDLVLQMLPYCQRKKEELGTSEEDTLQRVLQGLIHKHWCTVPQCQWIMQQVADRLGWKFPASASTASVPPVPGK